MLRAAQADEFYQVIVTRWDRLARDWSHCRDLIATLERFGVAVVAVADPLPPQDAMIVASIESRTLSSRIVAGLDRAKGEGRGIGRPPAEKPIEASGTARLGQRLALVAGKIRNQHQANHMGD
jgi:DNA invertase Pin-like site-specific DNA recombinase